MSGPLGDVFLLPSDRVGFVKGAEGKERVRQDMTMILGSEIDRGVADNHLSKDKSTATTGGKDVEWTQLFKGGGIANATCGSLSKSGNYRSFGNRPTLHTGCQQKHTFMGSGWEQMPWNYQIGEDGETAVNYFPFLGQVASSRVGNAAVGNSGSEDMELSGNGHEQLLADVLRECTSGFDAATSDPAEASESRTSRDDDFRADGKSPAAVGSHTIIGGIAGGSQISHQNLFSSSRGLGMSSPAFMQQPTRSPNHAIRNLFPEKSSGILRQQQQLSHEDIKGQKMVDEQQLLHVPKKLRRQESVGGDVGPLSSAPLSSDQVQSTNSLRSVISSGQYGNTPSASFDRDPLDTSLATLTESSLFAASSPFSSSFPVTSRRSSANPSPVTNPSPVNSSTFRTIGGSIFLPLKNSPDSSLLEPSLKDHLNYSLEGTNAQREDGGTVSDHPSERDTFLDLGDQRQCSHDLVLLGGTRPPRGRASMINISSSGWQSPPWRTGLVSMPSPVNSAIPATILSTTRMLHDSEQGNIRLDGNESRRLHPALESRRRLLIQKLLTTTDVGSLGRIILPKKEAETHLPRLPEKEIIEICMYDYEADRTWTLKYRYWPNNKSRMYLLENTGEFVKFHSLQQGDWIYICREPGGQYVVRAKKSPPIVHTKPAPQSAAGTGSINLSVAQDAGASDSSSRTATSQSACLSAGGTVGVENGSRSGDGGVLPFKTIDVERGCTVTSRDIHSSPFSLSAVQAGGAGGGGGVGVLTEGVRRRHISPQPHQSGEESTPESASFKGNQSLQQQQQQQQQRRHCHLHTSLPQLRQAQTLFSPTESLSESHDERQQQQDLPVHRLENFINGQVEPEVRSVLNEGGDLNLEDFPKLLDADDDIIDNSRRSNLSGNAVSGFA